MQLTNNICYLSTYQRHFEFHFLLASSHYHWINVKCTYEYWCWKHRFVSILQIPLTSNFEVIRNKVSGVFLRLHGSFFFQNYSMMFVYSMMYDPGKNFLRNKSLTFHTLLIIPKEFKFLWCVGNAWSIDGVQFWQLHWFSTEDNVAQNKLRVLTAIAD